MIAVRCDVPVSITQKSRLIDQAQNLTIELPLVYLLLHLVRAVIAHRLHHCVAVIFGNRVTAGYQEGLEEIRLMITSNSFAVVIFY